MEETKRYPVGIQTFSRIIRENYIYVDKTDLVWELAHYATYIFMSRPRRFGKSLLTTTLESYFRGEKELFEGLKIMQFEKEWQATAEGFYEYTMYLIFSMLNVYVRTQVKVWSSESHTSSLEDDRVATELGKAKCAGGRTDMVVWMPDTVYVFELKLNDTAQHALEQIGSKGYAFPYQTDDRRVVKVGVSFDADTRTPKDWIITK